MYQYNLSLSQNYTSSYNGMLVIAVVPKARDSFPMATILVLYILQKF